MAVGVLKYKDYTDLGKFMEGEQEWSSVEGYILSYRDMKDIISVDSFGSGNLSFLTV